MQPDDLLTSSQACQLLGITRPTLYSWMNLSKISPWKKLGNGETSLFLKSSLYHKPLRKYERLHGQVRPLSHQRHQEPTAATRVLLAVLLENEKEEIAVTLRKNGIQTITANNQEEMVALLGSQNPEAVIASPDQLGWDWIGEVKAQVDRLAADMPAALLVLSAQHTTPQDSAQAIKLGAWDLLKYPVASQVMLARIRWAIRRRLWMELEMRDDGDALISRDGLIQVYPESRTAELKESAGQKTSPTVRLTRKEMELLCLFIKRPGRIFSRKMILEVIWGYAVNINTRTVDRHIENLRQKLGPMGARIEAHYSLGYRFADTFRLSNKRR